MALQTLVCKHLRIDALAIVAHAQSELLVVVTNLDLDLPGLRMPEGIAKGLRRNLVDLVTKNRMELSRFAFDGNVECRPRAAVGRDFCSERADRQSEIVLFDGGGP